MKIRTDFVTNSSSSSFIVDLTIENNSGEKYTLAKFHKDYCDEGYSATRRIGPKTISGENGWDDPDENFDTERWSWHLDDVDESINDEEDDGWDRDLDPTEEDMHWRKVLGLSSICDVELVLNKMISGTEITDSNENAIKSLVARWLDTNDIALTDINLYTIAEELQLSGEYDMMEPSYFLGWGDALKSPSTDIEVLARRYKTDVESMRIFLDMDGHTYLTRRERIKNIRTGETFLRHIIYPSIYKDSRETDPLPIPFYNGSSSSDKTPKASDDKNANYEDFEVSGNVLVKYLGKFEESVIIPRKLGIKTIGEMAFADNEEITSVIIPEGVESIENYAFRFARNITEIKLPNTLVRIAESAFWGCYSLSKINIPDNCIDFSLGAFRNTDITVDKLSTNRIKLDFNGFLLEYTEQEDCSEDLVLPEYITGILPGAFSKIKATRKIVINHHCKLSEGVFEGIACLEEADISALRFETVPAKLFKNCTSLKRVALPNELYVIEKDAFSNCTELCEINLSDKLLYIDKTAFLNCNKLTGNLKSKIEEIASLPQRLKNVVEDTKKYIRTHGWLSFRFNASKDTYAYLFETKNMYKKWHKIFDNAFAFDRPDSLREGNIKFTIWADEDKIKRFLKKHSQKLSELMWKHTSKISGATDYLIVDTQNIPTVDRTVYKYSLLESGNADKASSYGSNSLEKAIAMQKDGGKIQIMALADFATLLEGKKVDRINKGKNFWDEDIEEEKLVVPTQNVSLGSEEIYISPKASVTPETILKTPIATLANNTDSNTVPTSKEAVSFDTAVETSIKATPSTSAVPKVVSSTESTIVRATNETPAEDFEIKGTVLVKYNGTSTIVGIPEKVKEIGASAFAGNQKIEEVILHEKVKKIGSLSFSGCGKLRAVSLGYGLQSIENQAFYECFSLESIEIGEQISSIASNAFYNCNNLKFNKYDNAFYLGNTSNPYIALIDAIDKNISWCDVHSDTVIICEYAFYMCSSLEKVVLPSGIRAICDGAFSNCQALSDIVIPDGVVSIGNFALSNCGLSQISIPDSVTSVQESSFSFSALETVSLGTGLKEVRGFGGCKRLSRIVIKDGATVIKQKAFQFCDSLRNVYLPSTVTKIENYAFNGCAPYKFNKDEQPLTIYIPDSVTTISKMAFGTSLNIKAIKIVTMRNSCADIYAKENGLEVSYDYVIEPETVNTSPAVTSGIDAAESIESIVIADDSGRSMEAIDGNAVLYKEGKELYNAGRYSDALKELEHVESDYLDVASLRAECRIKLEEEKSNSDAYDSGKNLYNSGRYQEALTAWAILPDNYRDVKTMRENCRRQLAGVASVTVSAASTSSTATTAIPKTPKASSAPKNSKTTKIAIAIGVVLTIIAIIIFAVIHANSDESLYAWEELSDGTVQINGIHDGKADKLIKDGVLTFPSEIEGKKVSVICHQVAYYYGYKQATRIIIPEGITEIGINAFNGCDKLKSINIPNSVKTIGDYAFDNCDEIENIVFGNQLTTIGTGAFRGCDRLESLFIPNSVAHIGVDAFRRCNALKTVTLGNGLLSIGKNAFAGCTSLTYVKFASPTGWECGSYTFTILGDFQEIPEFSLISPNNAATLLTDTYVSKEWRKD